MRSGPEISRVIRAALVCCWLATGAARAENYLDGGGRMSWSPDSQWLAFNWPDQDELVFISAVAPRAYMLKPVGELKLESSIVVSPAAPTKARDRRQDRVARVVPSPGRGRLAHLQWSPDSQFAAYRCARDSWALFHPDSGQVVDQQPLDTPYPWDIAARRVTFELVTHHPDGPRYRLLVRPPTGPPLKEIVFTERREVTLLSSARFRDNTFLTPDGRATWLPRWADEQWRLVREPVLAGQAAPLEIPWVGEAPQLWQLSASGRLLAIADRTSLRVGAVDDWANARTIPLRPGATKTLWAGTGEVLAIQNQTRLATLGPDDPQPREVTADCAPRFWGWRGGQLLFGRAGNGVANLWRVDPTVDAPPQAVAAQPRWQTAPREIAVSPDGTRLACVVNFLDGATRSFWQVWTTSLAPDAEWEVLLSYRERSTTLR